MENTSESSEQTVFESLKSDEVEDDVPQTSKHQEEEEASSDHQTSSSDPKDQSKEKPTFFYFLDESGKLLQKFRKEGGEVKPCQIARNVDLSDFVRRVDEVYLRHKRLFNESESEEELEEDMLERELLLMNSDFDETQIDDEEDEEEEEDTLTPFN